MRIGGIEAGGTKMVCAIGEVQTDKGQPGENQVTITERVTIPTEKPKITLPRMAAFFEGKGISSLGIGCFGPVDLHRASPTYGYITSTPKLEWQNVDMVGTFTRALGVPVGFDTDVNAAVLGEVTWGAAKDCDTAIYITVGTGVGVGVYCNGALITGWCTRRQDIFFCSVTRKTPTPENARTMPTVWKGLQAVRRWRRAGQTGKGTGGPGGCLGDGGVLSRGGGCKLCSDVFSAEDCAVGRNYAPEPALFNGAHESAGTAGRVYFQ